MDWFLKAVKKIEHEELAVTDVPLEPYFMDFMRDAPEPTGEEADDADLEAPKMYEEVRCIVLEFTSQQSYDIITFGYAITCAYYLPGAHIGSPLREAGWIHAAIQ